MSRRAAIPLAAAALGGLALLAAGPPQSQVTESAPPPAAAPSAPAAPEGTYLSHDWFEPPPRETRRTLLDAAGWNPVVACSLPNCRNCQIHATWKQAL